MGYTGAELRCWTSLQTMHSFNQQILFRSFAGALDLQGRVRTLTQQCSPLYLAKVPFCRDLDSPPGPQQGFLKVFNEAGHTQVQLEALPPPLSASLGRVTGVVLPHTGCAVLQNLLQPLLVLSQAGLATQDNSVRRQKLDSGMQGL